MVTVKLKYVMHDEDRHGNVRYYFRRKRTDKKIRLPKDPDSIEFREAHLAAMQGKPLPGKPVVEKIMQGSLEWLVNNYYGSTEFKAELGIESQKFRRNILKNVCKAAGTLPFNRIEPRHVMAWMDARADRPESANNLLRTLRGLFKFAMKRKLIASDPTREVTKVRTKSDGFHTWTIDEVRQFEAAHPIGTVPRLVLALALFTGLRRGDLPGLGAQHLDDDGWPVVTVKKTGKQVQIPVLPDLQAIIEATPRKGMLFIENTLGRGYTPASLGIMFRSWATKAKLNHCTLHGLRKAGATIATNNGATDRQLMAIFGWSKAEMASIYTAKRDNRILAGEGAPLINIRSKDEQKSTHSENQWVQNLKKAGNNNGV